MPADGGERFGKLFESNEQDIWMNVRSQIYVDKSGSLEELNRLIDTQQRFVCVTRPRRFGKSMAADMLSAYYGCKENTSALFDGLKIGTFNYKDGTDTVTFDDLKTALDKEKAGSDLDCSTAPTNCT